MKNKFTAQKVIIIVLMLAPILATLIAIPFMDESVPMHFDLSGNPDRMGSRWETLLVSGTALEMGLILMIITRIMDKREENGSSNAKAGYALTICVLVMLNAVTAYFLNVIFKGADGKFSSETLSNILFGILGAVFVVSGNLMPTLRPNSLIGIRTPATLGNEEVWKKTHHFGGILGIICGFFIILTAVFLRDMVCSVTVVVITMVYCVTCVIYASVTSARIKG